MLFRSDENFQPIWGTRANKMEYNQSTNTTPRARLLVMKRVRLYLFRGSLNVLYRSILTARRVNIEVGTAMRYNVVHTLHIVSPWYHCPSLIKISASRGIVIAAVSRSEIESDRIKTFVADLRKLGVKVIIKKTKMFPTIAMAMIVMYAPHKGYRNFGSMLLSKRKLLWLLEVEFIP